MDPLMLVVAVGKNGVIGKDGGLPWPRVSEDMKHFRRLTEGHAIIMGRKTFESIGRALPNRRNMVLSRTSRIIPGGEWWLTLEFALRNARTTDPEPRVIGGAELYAQTLPLATSIAWTEINRDDVDGDVRFPDFDRSQWRETSRRVGEDPTVVFTMLERIV